MSGQHGTYTSAAWPGQRGLGGGGGAVPPLTAWLAMEQLDHRWALHASAASCASSAENGRGWCQASMAPTRRARSAARPARWLRVARGWHPQEKKGPRWLIGGESWLGNSPRGGMAAPNINVQIHQHNSGAPSAAVPAQPAAAAAANLIEFCTKATENAAAGAECAGTYCSCCPLSPLSCCRRVRACSGPLPPGASLARGRCGWVLAMLPQYLTIRSWEPRSRARQSWARYAGGLPALR